LGVRYSKEKTREKNTKTTSATAKTLPMGRPSKGHGGENEKKKNKTRQPVQGVRRNGSIVQALEKALQKRVD